MTNGEMIGGIQPVKAAAAHELVLEQIRTAIALGRYAPGDRLPRERDLAEMLRVSRATVREALAVLASSGEVDVRRGRNGGLIVRDASVDEAAVKRELRGNREKLAKIFEFRSVIEGASAGLAARNRADTDLKHLREHLEEMDQLVLQREESSQDPAIVARFQAHDHDFHFGIAAASKNPWLIDATATVRVEMFRPVGGVFRRLEANANSCHQQIFDAIVAQDERGAHLWMIKHVEDTRQLIDSWLKPKAVSSPE